MKLNWGNWIAAVYIAFVLFIGLMVYLAFGEKWDLVAEDYYEQELKYQDKIDRKANVFEEGLKPKLYVTEASLNIEFPDSILNEVIDDGKVEFFRPSDAAKDVTVTFDELADEKELRVPLQILSKGKYLAKVSWKSGDKEYFYEQNVIIP